MAPPELTVEQAYDLLLNSARALATKAERRRVLGEIRDLQTEVDGAVDILEAAIRRETGSEG